MDKFESLANATAALVSTKQPLAQPALKTLPTLTDLALLANLESGVHLTLHATFLHAASNQTARQVTAPASALLAGLDPVASATLGCLGRMATIANSVPTTPTLGTT